MKYRHLKYRKLDGSLGAEITTFNVLHSYRPDLIKELKYALSDFQLLVFRDQFLDPGSLVNFAKIFGNPVKYPYYEPLKDSEFVVPIIKDHTTSVSFGSSWHTDSAYMEFPPRATVLYGVEIPPTGGDTVFSNMHDCYKTLMPKLREKLSGLEGFYSSEKVHGEKGCYSKVDINMEEKENKSVLSCRHPLVRRIPETGRQCIYFSEPHISSIVGLNKNESMELIDFLAKHSVQREFQTRVRWKKNTLVIWDNRSTQHIAMNDYPNDRREMHRVIVG